ncbi:hypothetical protein F5X68DRAFT_66495 [Plectosphaerella plurivora]|uniref:Uncharacterized protein n=1 Tax=Plectosphaerella plurivora TaxID=936078 RepID=A0A9P8VI76_9PEZI|nr:hypothetical protein F5X68DRAFT_66495 [Plectosphaerella plurivora]
MPTPPAPRRREDDAEILVHIAAPARTADDRHYRALASAYLSFQPGTRSCLVVPGSLPCSINSINQSPPLSSPPRHGSRHSSPGSSELSFSGAWGNLESPRLAVTPAHRHTGNHLSSQASNGDTSAWETQNSEPGPSKSTQQDSLVPPSEIIDSMPVAHGGQLGLVSPNRFIEHFMRPLQSSPTGTPTFPSLGSILPVSPIASRSAPVIIPGTPMNQPAFPVARPSKPVETPSFVVPDTPPPAERKTSPLPESSAESDVDVIEDTVLEGGPPIIKKRPAPKSLRAESEPVTSKRQRHSSDDPTPGPLTRSVSDSGANEDHETSNPLVLQGTDTFHLSLLEIDPPEPPIGTGDLTPESLITPNLIALAIALNPSHRFRPVERARDLRPLERGYWLIDCSDWGEAEVHKAWGFLHNYLSKGYAGWGTRSVRDERWGWIRVWCFGHVVSHIYLLLYLASERKLKTQGAQWIDGEGRVVLVTNGHD